MKKLAYLIVAFLLASNSFAQGHFVVAFTGNGQDHMNIFLVTASIGDVALEAGDEIAAFDGTICCGKITLNQSIDINNNSTFIDIKASRKDNGLTNGYTSGNAITYKFWNSKKDSEISGIVAEYFDPLTGLPTDAPTYSESGSAFVKLTVPAPNNRSADSNSGMGQSGNQDENVNIDTFSSIEKRTNSELKAQVEISTGIDVQADGSEIIIYPNPTKGNVHLKFPDTPNAETWITTLDNSGKILSKSLAVNKEEFLSLKGNMAGLYFIRIGQKIQKTYKIVLE